LRLFGHVERKEEGVWMSACRNLKVGVPRSRDIGRGKKTLGGVCCERYEGFESQERDGKGSRLVEKCDS